MNQLLANLPQQLSVLIASLLLGSMIYSTSPSQASEPSSDSAIAQSLQATGKRGRPNKRRGTATQGPACGSDQSTKSNLLTAIVPRFDTESLTLEPRPTFWFYIPYETKGFHSVKFVLKDMTGKPVYTSNLQTTNTLPGVVSFSLPSSTKELVPNQPYNWMLTLYCQDPESATGSSNNFFVQGAIVRVSATAEVQKALEAATTPQAKLSVYTSSNLWFDAVTELGNHRRTGTGNSTLTTAWNELLEKLDLPDIASKPVVNCCKPGS
jgi:hypothetical protein